MSIRPLDDVLMRLHEIAGETNAAKIDVVAKTVDDKPLFGFIYFARPEMLTHVLKAIEDFEEAEEAFGKAASEVVPVSDETKSAVDQAGSLAVPTKVVESRTKKGYLRVVCAHCGRIGRGKVPLGGDGSLLLPRSHWFANVPCPGNTQEARIATTNDDRRRKW